MSNPEINVHVESQGSSPPISSSAQTAVNNSSASLYISKPQAAKDSGNDSSSNNSVNKFGIEDYTDGEELNIVKTESHALETRSISRILTNNQSIENEAMRKNIEGIPIPEMGGGRRYPPELPAVDQYVVTFNGPNDPIHPHNWSSRKKFNQCFIIGYTCFTASFSSAIFSALVLTMDKIYHIATVVSSLSVSLFVFGFATGPVVWAPLSELYGRKRVLFMSCFLFTIFTFAVACSDRLEALLICRFFAGCLGAAPMVVVPASFADMFGNKTRGSVNVVFCMAIMVGPMMAPFIGAFIVNATCFGDSAWRWPSFFVAIFSCPSLILIPFFYSETHHGIILVEKAREIKRRTGNWGIHAAHDEFSYTMRELIENNLSRPLKMLFTEPILLLITIYNAFIYGMIYLFLTAYPIVFQFGYKMRPGVAELPYFGLILGELLAGGFCLYFEKDYVKKVEANNGKVVPEARLPPMILGAVAFPIGLLWFCWSGYYHDKVHWMVPTTSGLFTGFGTMLIFLPCINYIIDSYLLFAASAVAANTFLRSIFGGAFPLFAQYMFDGMHTNWAGLFLGLITIVLIICPILFVKYGKRLRQKSKYAFDLN